MNTKCHSEAAFETVIEQHLLANGYVSVPYDGFDRERAIFPEAVLDFIRDTQLAEWAKLASVRVATGRTIALLKERRVALIAAAVAGQIDVEAVA